MAFLIENKISIHALRVEGDIMEYNQNQRPAISIHALRVEGDTDDSESTSEYAISIHALRVEGDKSYTMQQMQAVGFLSTPSGWRATRFCLQR